MSQIIKSFTHPDGRLRANVVRRSNGAYGFTEEELQPNGDWFLLPAYFPDCPTSICDTAETPEREAKQRVDWLRWLNAGNI